MSSRHPLAAVSLFSALVLVASAGLGVVGWPPAAHPLVFSLILLGVLVVAATSPQATAAGEWDMRPTFVGELATLLLFGVPAAMVVAVAGAIAHELILPVRARRPIRLLMAALTVVVAIQVTGAVYLLAGGAMGDFVWPWHALPVVLAVVAYVAVTSTATRLLVPLVMRRPIDSTWPSRALRTAPPYALGASLAVAIVEIIAHEYWKLLPVVAVPLYFVWQTYRRTLAQQEEEHCRREVMDATVQGLSVIDDGGAITLWSTELERLLGCSRARALGRSLVTALPALDKTELPGAVDDVLATRRPRSVAGVGLWVASGTRLLDVRIVPVERGATLLWHDVTEGTCDGSVLRRGRSRLGLAAEAANDGLWEWDLQSHECFFSGRWRAMIGLPAQPGPGRSEDWLSRVHPDDVAALKEAIVTYLAGRTTRLQHDHRIRHEDGSYRWFVCRGLAARGPGRRPTRLAGSLTEGTVLSGGQQRARDAGMLDPLTGLANRAVFVDRLGRRLAESKERPGGDRFAVLYLDLDRFKVVNDSLGHLVGDELLTAVSRRLESCLRPADVLARLGGDEFAVLLTSLGDDHQANAIAFRIQESLRAPFSIGGREVFTTASIGIAIGLPHYTSPDEIMRDADTAMYHAKTRGKARHELFDADMHARVRDRLGLESDLRNAVSNNAFEVHYQPIVLLDSGMCVGFESLIRWNRNGEPVPPDRFIPLAEELGLIESLGTWVLREACRNFADWQRRFPEAGLDYITVNVSSRQLVQQNFLNVVERAVHDARLKPSDLRLEITETALMENPKAAAELLRELRDFGVKIYLDDFGTGYSSLSHLHKLPVDALKIDRSFVKSLLLTDRPAIVESILALARTLNTSVVAEGIESDPQALELERLGCTHAQGYLFSRPLSTQAAEELLERNQPLGPKRLPAARESGPDADSNVYGASGPFTWPEGIPVRGDAASRPGPGPRRAVA